MHLQRVIDRKSTLVEELVAELRNTKDSQASSVSTQKDNLINVPWQPVKTTRRTKTYKRRRLSQDNDYIQGSRYQPLDEIIDDENNSEADDISIFNDGGNFKTNNYKTSKKSVGINAETQIKRPQNVVKQKPENERYFKKTVPGICSYAEVSCQGRKTCIIGASLIKRIDIREFNQYLRK